MSNLRLRRALLAGGVAALLTVSVAGCGSTPGTDSGSPTPSPATSESSSPTTASGNTMLTMSVQGCEGCTITAIQVGPKDNYLPTPFTAAGNVTSGQVSLTVPTKYTKGMYFTATCTTGQCNSSNAQPVVVMRYPDVAVGADVSDSVAAAEKSASMCWAGTTESSAMMALTTTTFAGKDAQGNPLQSMRIWASPQQEVVPGTDSNTYEGGLGAQNYLHC
ncbi:MAG: hypothetical protein WCI29_09285 [Actinomycetes bacterium]